MNGTVDSAALWRAFDDAIAVATEWEGAPIEDKLAQHGLHADAVKEVLAERWATYSSLYPDTTPEEENTRMLLFAQAMTEGLLAGMRLR